MSNALSRLRRSISDIRFRIDEHYKRWPAIERRLAQISIVPFDPHVIAPTRGIDPLPDPVEFFGHMRDAGTSFGPGVYVTQLRNIHVRPEDWYAIVALLKNIVRTTISNGVEVPMAMIDEIDAARYDPHDKSFTPALHSIESFEATFDAQFRNISNARFEALSARYLGRYTGVSLHGGPGRDGSAGKTVVMLIVVHPRSPTRAVTTCLIQSKGR